MQMFYFGAAVGGRATLGVAAPAWRQQRLSGHGNPTWVGYVPVMGLVGLELIWDKLPSCPSRLEVSGAVARLASAGVGAALVHRLRADGSSPLLDVLSAEAGAMVGATVGNFLRRRCPSDWRLQLLAGLAEDTACIGLAVVALDVEFERRT
jgi:uncharacterized membrane protein